MARPHLGSAYFHNYTQVPFMGGGQEKQKARLVSARTKDQDFWNHASSLMED